MNRIQIKSFKAFGDEIDIPLEYNENLLIYGENGSGKSSIYEALKYFFFKEDIESKKISPAVLIGEGAQGEKDTVRKSYNNSFNNQDFELKINNESLDDLIKNNQYNDFIDKYDMLMLSQHDISNNEKIDIPLIIKKLSTTLNNSVIDLTSDECEQLERNINRDLETFLEEVKIRIPRENSDEGVRLCQLIDESRNFPPHLDDFSSYFNEAKLNIVMLLFYLNLFEQETKDSTKKRILVLDDIVTSLDFANRTFLIQYIFQNFSTPKDKIILLTHNTSFYNLLTHYINNYSTLKNKTKKLHLYQIENSHKYYFVSNLDSVSDIENRYKENPDLNGSIGNDLRKKFESLVHQFSVLLSVGYFEENKDLLFKLSSDKPFYLKGGKKNVYKLIDSILTTLDNQSLDNETLKETIKSQIAFYRVDPQDITIMQSILNNLKLYQKVTMHPLSHYQGGDSTNIGDKEVKTTITLMKKLESSLSKMMGTDIIEN